MVPPANDSRPNWRNALTDCSDITMPVNAPTSSTIGSAAEADVLGGLEVVLRRGTAGAAATTSALADEDQVAADHVEEAHRPARPRP